MESPPPAQSWRQMYVRFQLWQPWDLTEFASSTRRRRRFVESLEDARRQPPSMLQTTIEGAERTGAGPIGLLVANAGYLTVDNLCEPGPNRLIAVGKPPRPGAGR